VAVGNTPAIVPTVAPFNTTFSDIPPAGTRTGGITSVNVEAGANGAGIKDATDAAIVCDGTVTHTSTSGVLATVLI